MMACTARTLFSNTATFSRRSFRCRMSVGASDFQHGNNDIPHRKQSLALSLAKFNFSTSVDSRRSRRFCQDEFRRDFSTTPKPFSRKKNVKTTGEAEADKREFEPSLSFNYQATIAIMDIARAVSPVISMNAGFTLTSNFDLRTNAFDLALEGVPVQLELNTAGRGSYLFTIDRTKSRLNLVSPMSGAHTYFYDEDSQLWLSANSDRHDMRGMVTRDLLRHARGLATF